MGVVLYVAVTAGWLATKIRAWHASAFTFAKAVKCARSIKESALLIQKLLLELEAPTNACSLLHAKENKAYFIELAQSL